MKIKILLTLCLMTLTLHATNKTVTIEKAPAWVRNTVITVPKNIPMDDIDSGVYFVHVGDQVKAVKGEKTEYYSRFTQLVVNQEGVESVAQINVDYDPLYQELILNSLFIDRNGTRIDKTTSAKITMLQRESNLEERLYDGHLTANIIVDDVRVGDILEYSYTLIGSNPVYKDIFYFNRYLEWGTPIHHQSVRVLWDKPTPLNVKALNIKVKPQVNKLDNFTEYSVELQDTPARYTSSQAPSWHQPYGVVYFYENSTWEEVARWASSLYENVVWNGSEISALAKRIKLESSSQKEQVSNALEYVQSNIRYLGIEMGTSSHIPSHAKQTLERRYGDCKDKAVLLIAILKALDIEAYPALVNTDISHQLINRPPMVNAFDHVIVKAIVKGKTYWLDPTRTYQIGELDSIYQSDYGYTLVVDNKSRELESMKRESNVSKVIVKDFFDLSKGSNKEVRYESNTEYRGYNAEQQRYDLAATGITGLQKQYIDFYNGYYSDIEAVGKFESESDVKSGAVLQKEKYLIKGFWKTSKDKKAYKARFYANAISSYLSKPDVIQRNAPYELRYPIDIKQTITVKFGGDDWLFDNEEEIVDNKFFYFKTKIVFDEKAQILVLDYEYKSKVDHVDVDDISVYLAQRKKAKNLMDYGIIDYFEDQDIENIQDQNSYEPLLYLALFLVYGFGLMYVLISWFINVYNQPEFKEAHYYPVSITKAVFLSLLSFGLYPVFLFYRNFLYQKQIDQSSIMPKMRGLFNVIWYYPLYSALVQDSQARFNENRVLAKGVAVVFAVLYLLAEVMANSEVYMTLSLLAPLSALLLIPMLHYINDINKEHLDAYTYNSRWLARHSVLAILYVPIFIFVLASDINLIPSSKVVQGKRLMQHDVKFMHRKGIVLPNEKIRYFYSDSMLFIQDEGNGFTNTHVFSYWKEGKELIVQSAALSEVSKIDVTFAQDLVSNTIVNVYRDDGSYFILYISTEEGLDKTFVKELKALWKNARENNKTKGQTT